MSELYIIEGKADSWRNAIRLTSAELYNKGCVTDEFYDKCCEREESFPTGLTRTCPIAIPHASREYVKRQAICVLRMAEPVKFRSMSEQEGEIDVNYVINLALLDDSEHIKIISRVINCIKDKTFIDRMNSLGKDELGDFLVSSFLSDLND